MLKNRIIPVLTFNGFGLVKTKQFKNPRMVGNPVQAARVYNSRGVDELVFVDIAATKQKRELNLRLVGDVIKECFMPVGIGGGVSNINDINNLLKIGADKVIIKTAALRDADFIEKAVEYFGSQCISIALDVEKRGNDYFVHNDINESILVADFIENMNKIYVGEFLINSVNCDGMMDGFDLDLIGFVEKLTTMPIVAIGGAGEPRHFSTLLSKHNIEAVGASSLYHFTQFTPDDVKKELHNKGIPVRI
tara:strand:- start:944 stop:1690 length:747 start_codon:yes stop_codon:yes gene_type:complete